MRKASRLPSWAPFGWKGISQLPVPDTTILGHVARVRVAPIIKPHPIYRQKHRFVAVALAMASSGGSEPTGSESKTSNPISTENLAALSTKVKDLLPIPTDAQPVTDPARTDVSHTLAEDPTLSHALATEDHEFKGLAQQEHVEEVLDLGWNQEKQEIAAPLVGGLKNEDLWLLTRRFDKVRMANRPPYVWSFC